MTRNGTKRRDVIKGLAGSSALGLVGTVGATRRAQQPTIRYLTDRGGSKDLVNQIISDFEEEFSEYTVDPTYVPVGKTTDQELRQSIAAGNPYDVVFQAAVNAVPQMLEGSLAPVTSTIEDTGAPDVLPSGGESYFAPVVITGPNMGWYRTDLYEGKPETWDEWLTQAGRISEETDTEGFLIKSGRTNNAEGTTTNLLWNNGVEIYRGAGDDVEVVIDEGENRARAVETFQWMQEMNQYSPNGNGMSWGEGVEALQQESVAADLNLAGLPVATILENRPELVDVLAPTGFPVGPNKGDSDRILVYMEGHYIRNDGGNVEAAQQFVDYFQKSDRILDFILSDPSIQFPPSEELVKGDEMEQAEFHQNHPETLEFVRSNWDALVSIVNTGEGGAPNPMGGLQFDADWMGGAVEQMLVGGRSPEETVDWVAEKLRGMRE